MFCEQCGKELPDNAQFCAKCGARVKGSKEENIAGKSIVNQSMSALGKSASKKIDDVLKDVNLEKTTEGVKKAGNTILEKIGQWIINYRNTWREWRQLKREEQYIWFGIHGGAVILFLCIFIIVNIGTQDNSAAQVATESSVVDDGEVTDGISEDETMLADLNEQTDEIDKPVLMVEDGECTRGSICVFGSYQLDQQGADDLEWIILTKSGDKIFVLSRYLLGEQVPFGNNAKQGKMVGVAWEKSLLRTWLNDSFYNEAFTQEQKDAICVTTLNFEYTGTYQGTCQDKVFCLGVSEAEAYKDFLKATFYGTEISDKWWLGSISPDLNTTMSYTPYVDEEGNINKKGYLNSVPIAVRPAMWIDLNEVSVTELQ